MSSASMLRFRRTPVTIYSSPVHPSDGIGMVDVRLGSISIRRPLAIGGPVSPDPAGLINPELTRQRASNDWKRLHRLDESATAMTEIRTSGRSTARLDAGR